MHKINKETPLVLNVARSRSQGGVDDSDKEANQFRNNSIKERIFLSQDQEHKQRTV